MAFRRKIEIFNAPGADLRQVQRPKTTAHLYSRTISMATREAGIGGWYRLKILSPEAQLQRVGIDAFNANAEPLFAFDTITPNSRFSATIFLGRVAELLDIRLFLDGPPNIELSVQLRPISLAEFIWHSLKHGILQRPITFIQYYYQPPDPAVFSYEFPRPPKFANKDKLYQWWIAQREAVAYARVTAGIPLMARVPPAISILMTVYDPRPTYLANALQSIRQQTTDRWELCITDDASEDPEVRRILSEAARADPRIKLHLREQRGGNSAAANTAFAMATSPFISCLGHDDTLAPFAIETMAKHLAGNPGTKLLYSDCDSINACDERYDPFFKPDFSREFFYSTNYFDHFTVCDADAIRAIGGWRSALDGAQNYDLYLRVIATIDNKQIGHVPMILYHRRTLSETAASDIGNKPYAIAAGRSALSEHLQRRGIKAQVEIAANSAYRVRYELAMPQPKVSIIIPFRDKPQFLQQCVTSILELSTYQNYEIILVDNGSTEGDTLELLRSYRDLACIRILNEPGKFNYAEFNNRAANVANGEYLCLLNNDTKVITPDWLEDMVGYASQPGVGCVGAKLFYANGRVQHAGMVIGLGVVAGHVFLQRTADDPGYFGRLQVASNFSAVTGACLMVSRAIFREVGGLDEEHLPITFNDIDFCLKIRARGYRNVLTPFAELFHFESLSRGSDTTPEKAARFQREAELMRQRYGEALLNDPCYSPHLTLTKDDFSIRED